MNISTRFSSTSVAIALAVFSVGAFFVSTAHAFADPIPATSISVADSFGEVATTTLAAGSTLQLVLTVAPTDATVEWSSSNASKAAVDGSGLVSGVAAGDAVITVTAHNGVGAELSDTYSVTVIEGGGGGGGGDGPDWADIFDEIKTTLAGLAEPIDTNIDECAVLPQEPTACSGLYFEKTGDGRVTFTGSLNLTNEDTQDFLSNLGTYMEASAGSMSFNASDPTGAQLKDAGAQIALYGLNDLGFTGVPNIVVKDDDENVILPTDPDYPVSPDSISYDAEVNDGTLTFDASHFTTFDTVRVINTTTGEGFDTIQAAIDDASSGDTINVAAGTYDEQVVIDGKDLTLQGAGDTTIIRPSAPATLTSTYTYPDGTFWVGTVMSSVILVTDTDAVTVKNLKIDGINLTTLPAGASRLAGVLYGESGGVVDNVTVATMVVNGYSTRSYGIDLSAVGDARTVEVMNSNISNWSRNGIQAQGASLTADIHDNTLTGPGDVHVGAAVPNGILFIHGTGGNATGNTISALHHSASNSRSAGILFYDPLTAGIVAEDNDISDTDDGINVSASANDVIIRNNNLHDNLEVGIHLEDGATNTTITGNTITGNDMAGIRFAGATDPGTPDDPPGTGNVANNNTITGNAEGVVNYDSQTFDATSNWWGDATGPNHSSNPSATGDSVSDNVDYSPWLDGPSGVERNHNVEVVGGANYNSIQEAIDDADEGDTINVAAGTYEENLTVNKNLTLVGTDGAAETTIGDDGDDVAVLTITSDVTELEISGFTITGGGRGITTSGNLTNAILNIHDVVVTGNDSAGIYLSGDDAQLIDTTVTIADSEISNNTGGGIYIDTIDGTEDGGGSTLSITGSSISDNGSPDTGIHIDLVGNAEVSINENTIEGNNGNGLRVDDVGEGGSVDATNNWWGDETGPSNEDTNPGGLGDEVSSNADFTPWYLNAGRTILSSVATSEDDTLTSTGDDDLSMSSDTEGEADLPDGITDVVLSDDSDLDLSDGLNEDDEVTLNSGVDGEDIVLTNADLDTVTVNIEDETLITGPDGWDGIIEPPTEGTPAGGNAPAGFSVGSFVISVGSPDGTLTFDKAVTILLEGVTGTVGYRPALSNTWQTITNVCAEPYATPGDPPAGSECAISNGTDTKIVTFHFSSFGGMNPNPAPVVSSGGGGGGGGAPVGLVTSFTAPQLGTALAVATTGTGTGTGSGGQVLGASTYNFANNLTMGSTGNDVIELQKFLLSAGFSIPAGATGYFGGQTRAAVIAFQKARGITPAVGYVGPITRAVLNQGTAPTASDEQRSLLLQSLKAQLQALLLKIQQLMSGQS
ncbi:MAG: right-handed parallel beta-helix repeat-containing protein [Patescibacteria group bacterium]